MRTFDARAVWRLKLGAAKGGTAERDEFQFALIKWAKLLGPRQVFALHPGHDFLPFSCFTVRGQTRAGPVDLQAIKQPTKTWSGGGFFIAELRQHCEIQCA